MHYLIKNMPQYFKIFNIVVHKQKVFHVLTIHLFDPMTTGFSENHSIPTGCSRKGFNAEIF